ncbi:MAG: dipeptide ABC transporter ATP-binding protein [Verrucomicrobiota bacterium]|nr:dipeptide ABC transporter ATP-binding protein [Verrucomicrobiota bacterium]
MPLLEVRELKTHFPIHSGVLQRSKAAVKAVDGVSFQIERGETVGLVGESGCGKSTLGKTLLRLIEPTSGQIFFKGREVTSLSQRRLRPLRRHMQMIFQDPYSSLNGRMTVEQIVGEGLRIHRLVPKREVSQRVRELLEAVGLNEQYARRYPHEFSGGQRQRIGIARSLALQPDLIVADEPVSALDVSVQAQIINLMVDLQKQFNLTYLFVAHDLAVVEHISDRVIVMYLGKIVEQAAVQALYSSPLHPYTSALIASVPSLDPAERRRQVLGGDVPSPVNPPPGCAFHTRCPLVEDRCRVETPPLREVRPGHFAACHLAKP